MFHCKLENSAIFFLRITKEQPRNNLGTDTRILFQSKWKILVAKVVTKSNLFCANHQTKNKNKNILDPFIKILCQYILKDHIFLLIVYTFRELHQLRFGVEVTNRVCNPPLRVVVLSEDITYLRHNLQNRNTIKVKDFQ